MDCAEEVALLRNALERRAGIRRLTFDVLHARMNVDLEGTALTPQDILRAVAATGMQAELWSDGALSASTRPARPARLVLTAASGLLLIAALVWQSLASGNLIETFLVHSHDRHELPAGVIALYAASVVSALWFFLHRAWAALRHMQPDMNFLVCISVVGAVSLGEWGEGATVAFLFALANLLEAYSLARARSAIDALLHVAPGKARVVHGDHDHLTALERVAVGSVIRVLPGERIPFDGTVVAGASMVDQAPLTGEATPLRKETGSGVLAGTINTTAALDIRTCAPVHDTTLGRIIRMVEESYHHRAPIEQWTERFARRYTPAMVGLALGVAVLPPLALDRAWSYWFYQGMVVLLIACPCALVISTPVTIVAALASAARRGVLIKGGAYLELAAGLRLDGSLSALSIAVSGHDSDAAVEKAHVVVMSQDAGQVQFLVHHARRAMSVVKQNVVFALAAKVVFLVLAAFGIATLWMAVAADTGATLLVTLNGLRMLRARV